MKARDGDRGDEEVGKQDFDGGQPQRTSAMSHDTE